MRGRLVHWPWNYDAMIIITVVVAVLSVYQFLLKMAGSLNNTGNFNAVSNFHSNGWTHIIDTFCLFLSPRGC